MEPELLNYLYLLTISIFIAASIISLSLSGKNSTANYAYNSISVLGSLSGIAFSLLKLTFLNEYVFSMNLKTNIPNLEIIISVDNVSAFFIFAISILSVAVSIYSLGYNQHYFGKESISKLGFLYNLFVVSMILVVTSGHLFFFLVAWELMSLVSYFLVIYEGDRTESQEAGRLYLIMTHVGTAFITAAFVLIYIYSGGNGDIREIDLTLMPEGAKNLIFALTLLGFGTKAGIIPLHIWLPSAHPAAPSSISALMSGVMIKTAVYGIIRFDIIMLGGSNSRWGTILLVLGGISAAAGIAFALMEIDIKRLLAYSSVENMGIIFMGLGITIISTSRGDMLLAAFSFTAAMLHLFNHSLFKGLLFLGAGAVDYATHTRNMEKLGGLIKLMPYTAVLFLIGAVSISALPPLNGFVSEWLTYQSMFAAMSDSGNLNRVIIVICAASLAMTGALAIYAITKTFGISFLANPRSEHASKANEVPLSMLAGMGLLAVLCILSGMMSGSFISLIDSINSEVFSSTVLRPGRSFMGILIYPVQINNVSLSPLIIFAAILIIIAAVAIFIRVVSKGTKIRSYGTWDCGYIKLTPKMQYTATGFSKPLRIVFRMLFRPRREFEELEGSGPYFVKSARYTVSHQSLIEKYMYEPVIRNVFNLARRIRWMVQTGSIHAYLIYIFTAIIAMLVYYAKA